MNFLSQREMVTASLAAVHQPDVYRKLVPGEQRAADQGGPVPTRVHARAGEETGCDGCPPAPTQLCKKCGGDGEIFFRRDPHDPQTEDSEYCRACGGTGLAPTIRPIAGGRRFA